MERITLELRTKKKSGNIRLRFRLRDGRNIQLYYKSGIVTSLEAISKFQIDGQVKPRVTVYDEDLRRRIHDVVSLMHNAYVSLQDSGVTINNDSFNEAIQSNILSDRNSQTEVDMSLLNMFRDYTRKASEEGVIGASRLEKYEILLEKLSRFLTIKRKNNISVRDFDYSMLLDFRGFMFDEYKYVEDWPELYGEMSKRNIPSKKLSQNTVATNLKILNTFFSELEDEEVIEKSPFKAISKNRRGAILKEQYDSPVYLEKSEVLRIISKKVPRSLESTKDAFLFQCSVGFRISDFLTFSEDNVSVSPEGIPYVHYLPKKTAGSERERAEVETPLVRFAFDILMNTKCSFPILKYVTGEKGYNARIKQLLAFCGINRTVQRYNEETKSSEYKPIHSIASSKLCRSTHVDMLNKVQVDMYAAGLHKAGSDAVNRYTKLELKDRFQLMNYAFDQKPFKVDNDLKIIEQ